MGMGEIGTSVGVGFVPVLGELKDIQEAAMGVDLITGEKLKTWERWVGGGAAVISALVTLGSGALGGALQINKWDDAVAGVVKTINEFSGATDTVKGASNTADAASQVKLLTAGE